MTLMSRLKWLAMPLAFGLGAAGGVVVNQQIMLRSIRAREQEKAAELAAAQAPKPPAARPSNPIEVPPSKLPSPGSTPFDLSDEPGQPPAEMPDEPPPVGFDRRAEPEPPPGYFDLPAPNKNDGTDPPIIKAGQILTIEVLEALPGRPITGDRVVRPDGTVSLGFYGDLRVAGLNRLQIKVKLLQHMHEFIRAEVLGLMDSTPDGGWKLIPPVESNRVFVDESLNYYPAGPEQAARPTVKEGFPEQPATNARVDELGKKLDRIIQELEQLHGGRRPANPPNPFLPPT